MNANLSVTVHYAHAILQAAERLGLPLAAEWRVLERTARIPLVRQDALWEAFCTAAADPLIGLRLGCALQVGHLDMVGALLMSCDNIGEALEALLEYYPIVGEGGEFALHREQNSVLLVYRPLYLVRREERVEAVLASLVGLTRWIAGERVSPQCVNIAHAPRAEQADYAALLECPLQFCASEYALRFASADLAVPLIQTNARMREHLRALADAQLEGLDSQSLVGRVQQLLRQQPRWGKERVAEQFGLSGRHLVRKLAEEGTSFKLVREQVLQHMAENLLCADNRVSEVAERLGFSDESAFVKAFRRWSGLTPAQFRQSQVLPRGSSELPDSV